MLFTSFMLRALVVAERDPARLLDYPLPFGPPPTPPWIYRSETGRRPRADGSCPRFQRRKPTPHAVFGDDARKQKVLQILGPAGFCSAPAHLKTAERLPAYNGPGDGSVDVKVATDELGPCTFNIHRDRKSVV